MTKTVILGAGISGLYTGFRLAEKGKQEVTILEKSSTVGGMSKSFSHKGFILDFGPHKIYSVLPGIMDEYQRVMDNKLLSVTKYNSIFLQGKRITFPLNPLKLPFQINWFTVANCGVGFAAAKLNQLIRNKPVITYEDYFLAGFGRPAYNLLFRDLASKVWGEPTQLTEELSRKRVPVPDIFGLLSSMIKKKSTVSAKEFLYPKKGFGELGDMLTRKLKQRKGNIQLNSEPTRIEVKNKKVVSITYKTPRGVKTFKRPDFVVSTIHILDLLNLLRPAAPKAVIAAANRLKFRGLALVFVFVDKEHVLPENWTFYPEKKYIFNRVSEPKWSSSAVCPPGKTYIIAEVTLDPSDPLFSDEDALLKRVLADLEKAKVIKQSDIKETLLRKARRIYPVYDLQYRANLVTVLKWLDTISNLFTIGRPGLFNYNNTDHCIDTGIKLADIIIEGGSTQDWIEARKTFNKYSIID